MHDEPLSGTQTNTGTLFQLTIAPPAGYEFVTASGYNGARASLSGGNAIGIKILLRSASSDSYLLEMGGKLREVTETAGGNGTEKLFDWNAKAECEKAFYIESNQAGNLKEIIVPAGTSVTYTAYEGTSPKASNWTVNGETKNNESSIIFNRSWWDVPGWFSASMGTPNPGTYTISASPTDKIGVSDSGSMTIVGVAAVSGHGKTSSRSEIPSKWKDTEIIYAQPKSHIKLSIALEPNISPGKDLMNRINWSVSGSFATITPDKTNKLNATFVPDRTGNYIVTASCGESQRLICIKVSAPKLYSVSFRGNIKILKDKGGEYSGVAWKDSQLQGCSDMEGANADSSKKYQPVAYCSTATMSATAVFKLNYKDSNGKYVNYNAEAAVKKLRFAPSLSPGDWSAPVDFNMAGTEVTAAHSIKQNAQVGYESNYMLAWEVGFGEPGTADSDLSWERSYTEHELYLTFKQALPKTKFYETVLHIGCTNANGKSDEQQIVSSIWNEFTDCSVKRKKQDEAMAYWGSKTNSENGFSVLFFTVEGLLSNEDGRCGAWQAFMIELLKAQGISASACDLMETNSDYLHLNSVSKLFLIKNYRFNEKGTSGNPDYPYKFDEISDLPGIPAQGNPNPQSIFADHAIVLYNGVYYDPSYGITASSLTDYKDKSLAGWVDLNTNFVTNDVSKHNLLNKRP